MRCSLPRRSLALSALVVSLPGCQVIANDLRGGGVGVISVLIAIALVATITVLVRRSAG